MLLAISPLRNHRSSMYLLWHFSPHSVIESEFSATLTNHAQLFFTLFFFLDSHFLWCLKHVTFHLIKLHKTLQVENLLLRLAPSQLIQHVRRSTHFCQMLR